MLLQNPTNACTCIIMGPLTYSSNLGLSRSHWKEFYVRKLKWTINPYNRFANLFLCNSAWISVPSLRYGGLKGSNTNQFPKTRNSFPKHKSVSQSTEQFPKTQIDFPKHKSIFQNTNQFSKTQINFPKHKLISRNTNQFPSQKTGHYLNMSEIAWKAEWRTWAQGLSHPIWRLSERAVFWLF